MAFDRFIARIGMKIGSPWLTLGIAALSYVQVGWDNDLWDTPDHIVAYALFIEKWGAQG